MASFHERTIIAPRSGSPFMIEETYLRASSTVMCGGSGGTLGSTRACTRQGRSMRSAVSQPGATSSGRSIRTAPSPSDSAKPA